MSTAFHLTVYIYSPHLIKPPYSPHAFLFQFFSCPKKIAAISSTDQGHYFPHIQTNTRMKPLFQRFILLSFAWMLLGSATIAKKPSAPAAKQTMYYFYWSDSDQFFEYATVANACNDIQNLIGAAVSTNSSGGTLVSNGYTNSVQPHNTQPAVLLYQH